MTFLEAQRAARRGGHHLVDAYWHWGRFRDQRAMLFRPWTSGRPLLRRRRRFRAHAFQTLDKARDEGGDAIWRKRERRCGTKHQDPFSVAVPQLLVGDANQHRNHSFLSFEGVENNTVDLPGAKRSGRYEDNHNRRLRNRLKDLGDIGRARKTVTFVKPGGVACLLKSGRKFPRGSSILCDVANEHVAHGGLSSSLSALDTAAAPCLCATAVAASPILHVGLVAP
jgi:hypothetical protein